MDDLAARFRAGDPAAVRSVYDEYGGALRAVARSILHEPPLVAEAVQETMLRAWRAAATWDPDVAPDTDRPLAPWLYAIARNTAIDIARRERRPTAGAHAPEVDPAVEPIGFERTWEAFEVRRAIDRLPAGEQDVVRLTHLHGLTHEETAVRLGIPVGTVKSRSSRAHRRLAEALAHLAPANRPTDGDVAPDDGMTEHHR